MSPEDIDMFQPYDDFLIAVMLQMEQNGFCDRGEGAEFILGTDMSPSGKLPVNTGGGQISAGQPGLGGGGVNLTEAIRQHAKWILMLVLFFQPKLHLTSLFLPDDKAY